MIAEHPSYTEIIDFFAGNNPEAVAEYRLSPAMQNRLAALLENNREGTLTAGEQSELDSFVTLEHLVRMTKARARQLLARR